MKKATPKCIMTCENCFGFIPSKYIFLNTGFCRIHFFWGGGGHCGPTQAMTFQFMRFLDHTQGRTTVRRIPLDEWSVLRGDFYLGTVTYLRNPSYVEHLPLRVKTDYNCEFLDIQLDSSEGEWARHCANSQSGQHKYRNIWNNDSNVRRRLT